MVKQFEVYRDDKSRIRYKFTTISGNITKLVIQLEILIDDTWTHIIRYDNAHGFFHKDTIYPHKNTKKEEVIVSNLKEAFNIAKEDLTKRSYIYIREYKKHVKSGEG